MKQTVPPRPRDGLALYYGIHVEGDVAARLDQAVLRTHARVFTALMQVPSPDGFARIKAKVAPDG